MPPSFAGEAVVAYEPNIRVFPGIAIDIVADDTAGVGLSSDAIIRRLWKCKSIQVKCLAEQPPAIRVRTKSAGQATVVDERRLQRS